MLREKLRAGDPLFGFGSCYADPGIIEAIGNPTQGARFAFCWIDGQHGYWGDVSAIAQAIRACERMGLASLVRVPDAAAGRIGQVLDLNADGIIVPCVNTPEEARAVVRAARFAPLGARSFGGRRVYDLHGRGYPGMAAGSPLVLAQIETVEALKNVEAIAAVDGVDVLFLGPDDMKVSRGLPLDLPIESPQLADAARAVAAAAGKFGKAAFVPVGTAESLRFAIDAGYRLLNVGSDVGFMRKSLAETAALIARVTGKT